MKGARKHTQAHTTQTVKMAAKFLKGYVCSKIDEKPQNVDECLDAFRRNPKLVSQALADGLVEKIRPMRPRGWLPRLENVLGSDCDLAGAVAAMSLITDPLREAETDNNKLIGLCKAFNGLLEDGRYKQLWQDYHNNNDEVMSDSDEDVDDVDKYLNFGRAHDPMYLSDCGERSESDEEDYEDLVVDPAMEFDNEKRQVVIVTESCMSIPAVEKIIRNARYSDKPCKLV